MLWRLDGSRLIEQGAKRKKGGQPRIVCLAKLLFKREGKSSVFPGKHKLKEMVATRLA